MNIIEPPGGDMFGVAFPGAKEAGAVVVSALGFRQEGWLLMRYRTAWLEHEMGWTAAVYCRIGGPNRPAFQTVHEAICEHPAFHNFRDDEFDQTYCTYRFRIPDFVAEAVIEAAEKHGETCDCGAYVPVFDHERDTDKMWRDVIADIDAGNMSPAQTTAADQLLATLLGIGAPRGEDG